MELYISWRLNRAKNTDLIPCFFIIQETLTALQNPMAHISSVEPEFADLYQENLSNAKQVKAMNATNKVSIIQWINMITYQCILWDGNVWWDCVGINFVMKLPKIPMANEPSGVGFVVIGEWCAFTSHQSHWTYFDWIFSQTLFNSVI